MTKITISDGASMKKPPANGTGAATSSRTASTCAGSVGFRASGSTPRRPRSRRSGRRRSPPLRARAAPARTRSAGSGEPAAAERHRGLFHLHGDAGEDARRHEDGEGRQCRVRERRPSTESSIPQRRNMTASGIERITIGNARVPHDPEAERCRRRGMQNGPVRTRQGSIPSENERQPGDHHAARERAVDTASDSRKKRIWSRRRCQQESPGYCRRRPASKRPRR